MIYREPVELAYNKGLHCAAFKQYEQAVCHFSEAIRLRGGHADAYYQRALMFCRLERDAEAFEDLRESIRLHRIASLQALYRRRLIEKLAELKKAA